MTKKKWTKPQPYFLNNCDYCIHHDEEKDSCNIGGLDDDVKCIDLAEVRSPYELDEKTRKDVIKWYREDMPDFLNDCRYCRHYKSRKHYCAYRNEEIAIPAYDGLECEKYVLLPLDRVSKKTLNEIRIFFKVHPCLPTSPLAAMRKAIYKYRAEKLDERRNDINDERAQEECYDYAINRYYDEKHERLKDKGNDL